MHEQPQDLDPWAARAAHLPPLRPGRPEPLIDLARRYLEQRGDHALGLGPLPLLSTAAGGQWLLYWAAARRTDDAIEGGLWKPSDLDRRALVGPDPFANRCVEALLGSAHTTALRNRIRGWIRKGLDGLGEEGAFIEPRPRRAYLALLDRKSVPSMEFLDELMFPTARMADRQAHAKAFAYSTQWGDDCRDALRDAERGRCFVTLEEVGGRPWREFIASDAFARGRVAACEAFLRDADTVTRRFPPLERQRAERLRSLWAGALRSGQVRPTHEHLRLASPMPQPATL